MSVEASRYTGEVVLFVNCMLSGCSLGKTKEEAKGKKKGMKQAAMSYNVKWTDTVAMKHFHLNSVT